VHAVTPIDVSTSSAGIENPYIADSERHIIADAFQNLAHAVLLRKDLEAEKRRANENLFGWAFSGNNADIGNAKSISPDLNALFGINMNSPLMSPVKHISAEGHLQIAMVLFAQVALQDSPL
jgi:hypothetical protein